MERDFIVSTHFYFSKLCIKTFGVLILNLAVAATVVFFFLFIGYMLNSVFNSEEREAD